MNYKIYTIDEIKKRFETVAKKYEINEAYLFGSYARGEATTKSDVDFCIKAPKIRTLFQLAGFYGEVKNVMKKNIDVIEYDGMYDSFKNEAEKEFVKIYG